ncbi:MAG: cytochrome c [Pseudomonadota bacterium]
MNRRFGPMLLVALSLFAAGCQREQADAVASADGEMPTNVNFCASCHGVDGRARVAGYPHIAGQDRQYMLNQLRAYRSGDRRHNAMQAIVGALDDAELEALATWYATQPACPPGP